LLDVVLKPKKSSHEDISYNEFSDYSDQNEYSDYDYNDQLEVSDQKDRHYRSTSSHDKHEHKTSHPVSRSDALFEATLLDIAAGINFGYH